MSSIKKDRDNLTETLSPGTLTVTYKLGSNSLGKNNIYAYYNALVIIMICIGDLEIVAMKLF